MTNQIEVINPDPILSEALSEVGVSVPKSHKREEATHHVIGVNFCYPDRDAEKKNAKMLMLQCADGTKLWFAPGAPANYRALQRVGLMLRSDAHQGFFMMLKNKQVKSAFIQEVDWYVTVNPETGTTPCAVVNAVESSATPKPANGKPVLEATMLNGELAQETVDNDLASEDRPNEIDDEDFDKAMDAARSIAQDDKLPPGVDPAENDKTPAVRTAKECLDKCTVAFGYTVNEILKIWRVSKLGEYGDWNKPETAGNAYYEAKNRYAFDGWLSEIGDVDASEALTALGIAEWDVIDWTSEAESATQTTKMKPYLEARAKKTTDEKATTEQRSLAVVSAPVSDLATSPMSKVTYWQKWMITPTQVCEHAVRSHLYRGITTTDHAMAVVLTGLEIGISPMVALRQLPLINNVPTATAELQLAMLQRNGVRVEILERDTDHSTIRMTRADTGVVLEQTYTMADANRAGLTVPRGKDNPKSMYDLYPKEMLTWANIRTMAKQIAADILLGLGLPLYTAEEMDADIDPLTGELAASP